MHLLILEDEPRMAALLRRTLEEEGHRVTVQDRCAAARATIENTADIDILIIDRNLPYGDGLDLIRGLRAAGDRRPALCLTARDRVDDRVEGLHGGADDYLGKPFALEELLARVEALGRRRTAAPDPVLTVGTLRIDREALRVWRGDQELRLTAQELRLLVFLAENQGRVLSKARIRSAVWDIHHDPGTNVVEVYISYLRAKVDRAPGADHPLIHTVRGLGYVLEDRPR